MSRRNKYPGHCCFCGGAVAPFEGDIVLFSGKSVPAHTGCAYENRHHDSDEAAAQLGSSPRSIASQHHHSDDNDFVGGFS